MNALLIVGILVVVLAVIAAAAFNPILLKKQDSAVKVVKDALGADRIKVIEPRTTAMGTEPAEAGGQRGMGCLALSDTDLMFVKWSGLDTFRIARSTITSLETEAEDPTAVHKLTLHMNFSHNGADAVALFRLPEPVPWLKELGYDWGPDGPPPDEPDDEDD